jgi:hypothetical protein
MDKYIINYGKEILPLNDCIFSYNIKDINNILPECLEFIDNLKIQKHQSKDIKDGLLYLYSKDHGIEHMNCIQIWRQQLPQIQFNFSNYKDNDISYILYLKLNIPLVN